MNENNFKDRPTREMTSPHVALTLVLDVSGSMVIDDRIGSLNKSINEMIETAKKDERLCNVLDLGIFVFGEPNRNYVYQGFRAIRDCEEINLQATDDYTYVADALNTAVDRLKERTELYDKTGGAYIPWLILISDGGFHDASSSAFNTVAERIKQREKEKKLHFFGFGVPGYERTQLEQFTATPDRVFDIEARDFTKLFDWIGRSMVVISRAAPDSTVKLPTLELKV